MNVEKAIEFILEKFGGRRCLAREDRATNERVEELLRQRQSSYAEAHVTIDTSGLAIEQVVEKILHFIRPKNS